MGHQGQENAVCAANMPGQGGRATVDTVRMLLAQQLPVTAFARSQHIDLTVVDCGMADECTRSAWEQVFATQLLGLPVLRVIVTHFHPDHMGLAAWLTERWQCRLWISATDYNLARLASVTGR